MSRFGVSPEKEAQLLQKMAALGIREADLTEKFVLGSGRGGQKINKTSSCVYLSHAPSGLEIKCQHTRSQAMNRFMARRELCERLEERILGAQSKRQQEIERIRRQKRKRTHKQKQKMLADKHHQADKKIHRKPIRGDRD